MLIADAAVALECDVFSIAPACRRDDFHVFAYPQKLAAQASAFEEPCVEDVDAGVFSLDLLPPHPAAIAATSAKAKTICAVRAIT